MNNKRCQLNKQEGLDFDLTNQGLHYQVAADVCVERPGVRPALRSQEEGPME